MFISFEITLISPVILKFSNSSFYLNIQQFLLPFFTNHHHCFTSPNPPLTCSSNTLRITLYNYYSATSKSIRRPSLPSTFVNLFLVDESHAVQVLIGDLEQRVLRPFGEPVDGHVVHERREHANVVAKGFADRRHAQYHVQVAANSFDQEFEDVLRRIVDVLLLQGVGETVANLARECGLV